MRRKCFSLPELNLDESIEVTEQKFVEYLSRKRVGFYLDTTDAAILDLLHHAKFLREYLKRGKRK